MCLFRNSDQKLLDAALSGLSLDIHVGFSRNPMEGGMVCQEISSSQPLDVVSTVLLSLSLPVIFQRSQRHLPVLCNPNF